MIKMFHEQLKIYLKQMKKIGSLTKETEDRKNLMEILELKNIEI